MPLSREKVAFDSATLQEFKGTKYYEVWSEYLEMMGDEYTSRLISYSGQHHNDLTYYQGIMAGLKMAQQIPENLKLWDEQFRKGN